MADKLSDLFERARTSVVEWNGARVHSMFEVEGIDVGQRVEVRFTQTSSARPQGLRIKVRGGALQIAGDELDNIILWSDTAPVTVSATVTSRGGSVDLRLWNCWRDPAGTTHAWIGNAGMLVEENGKAKILLRCSDGFGDAAFDDLVVSLTMQPAEG